MVMVQQVYSLHVHMTLLVQTALKSLGDKGKIVVDDSKKVTIKRLKTSENEMSAT